VNEDIPQHKKSRKEYKQIVKQKENIRKKYINDHNEERTRIRRGFTNNTTSDQMAPPNNVNQQDFHMKTAPLHPRVVAPVWDRRVISPRSLD
jgi:hypothetical protein